MTEPLTPPLATPDGVPPPAQGDFWALLPCAGVGARAVSAQAASIDLPKQYQPVAGQPMVLHTLAAFAGVARLRGTLVAVAPGDPFLQAYAGPSFLPWIAVARRAPIPCGAGWAPC